MSTRRLRSPRAAVLHGNSHTLHDVLLPLTQGRVRVLPGRNGAVKTTCINTIIDFPRPRDGAILNIGRIVYDGPAEGAPNLNQPELLHVHLGVY